MNKLFMFKKKLLKSLARVLPGNSLRVSFLRLSNYSVGKNVYIGEELIIIDDLQDRSVNLIIEDRVAISPRVTFVMHSAPNWSRIRNIVGDKRGRITIKQDSWIGTGAVILPGIEIGEGAGIRVIADDEWDAARQFAGLVPIQQVEQAVLVARHKDRHRRKSIRPDEPSEKLSSRTYPRMCRTRVTAVLIATP